MVNTSSSKQLHRRKIESNPSQPPHRQISSQSVLFQLPPQCSPALLKMLWPLRSAADRSSTCMSVHGGIPNSNDTNGVMTSQSKAIPEEALQLQLESTYMHMPPTYTATQSCTALTAQLNFPWEVNHRTPKAHKVQVGPTVQGDSRLSSHECRILAGWQTHSSGYYSISLGTCHLS